MTATIVKATGSNADLDAGTASAEAAITLATGSRVRLRDLSERRDRDGWIIGRIETGSFISVPDVAHRIIALLAEDCTVGDVASILRAETGSSFAVTQFVAALDDLGFLAAVDDHVREDADLPRPSLPWLQPSHVRWLLHPLAAIVVMGLAAAAVVMLALHPALVPSYHMLVWSRRAGLVISVDAAIAWALILVHELAHLATARAAGVMGRITLSTRLQFLAAQTDVSGVWSAPRRTRLTVYLAGTCVDVCEAGIFLLILGLASPHGLARSLLALAFAETTLRLSAQFMVFMRTDMYFVLQDLTGCSNLYADGSAYLRYLARRGTRLVRSHYGELDVDPSEERPLPLRRTIRAYSAVLLFGTAICLGVEFVVTLPALIAIIARAVSETGVALAGTLDGSAALAIVLVWYVLWTNRWWCRHRHQVRSMAGQHLRARKEV